jgi:hypothetical protein
LGRIQDPGATDGLVKISLEDDDPEIRLSAIDELQRTKPPVAVAQYVKALKSTDNPTINRAALGLAAMEDRSAIAPLIDVLVTSHKFKVGSNSNQISSTFSPAGGGGLSVGSKTSIITRTLANEAVRDALVKLSGVNFGYEKDDWKAWLVAQRQVETLDVRRGP